MNLISPDLIAVVDRPPMAYANSLQPTAPDQTRLDEFRRTRNVQEHVGTLLHAMPLFQAEATSFNMMEELFRGAPNLDHFEKMVGTYQKRKEYGEISLAAWLTFFIYRAVRINSANRR